MYLENRFAVKIVDNLHSSSIEEVLITNVNPSSVKCVEMNWLLSRITVLLLASTSKSKVCFMLTAFVCCLLLNKHYSNGCIW